VQGRRLTFPVKFFVFWLAVGGSYGAHDRTVLPRLEMVHPRPASRTGLEDGWRKISINTH
jgi:hypothetical protein